MNKGISFVGVCAYASLLLSVTMFILWASNVGGFSVVNLDSFVGVIVGLLAIIVTFAIGWQIYNVIEMNKKIEQLDEKLKEVQDLKAQLEEYQVKLDEQRHEACHFSHMGIAHLNFSRGDYLGAFRFYQSALSHSLQMDSLLNLTNMAEYVLKAIESTSQSTKLLSRLYDNVERIDKEIRQSKHFKIIQDSYDKAYSMYKKKVIQD